MSICEIRSFPHKIGTTSDSENYVHRHNRKSILYMIEKAEKINYDIERKY